MKKLLYIIASLLLLTSTSYLSGNTTDETSKVSFKIKNMGLNVDGEFEDFKTTINYDKANPEKSTFKGIIKVTSINTGIEMRDKHLRKDDYFDVEKYPEIKFISTSASKKNANTLTVIGNLTIRNITKKVSMEVKIEEKSGKIVFSTDLKINRIDYGVGSKSMVTGNDVYIYLHIVQ